MFLASSDAHFSRLTELFPAENRTQFSGSSDSSAFSNLLGTYYRLSAIERGLSKEKRDGRYYFGHMLYCSIAVAQDNVESIPLQNVRKTSVQAASGPSRSHDSQISGEPAQESSENVVLL